MEEEENKAPMKIKSRDSTFINSKNARHLLLRMKQKKKYKKQKKKYRRKTKRNIL